MFEHKASLCSVPILWRRSPSRSCSVPSKWGACWIGWEEYRQCRGWGSTHSVWTISPEQNHFLPSIFTKQSPDISREKGEDDADVEDEPCHHQEDVGPTETVFHQTVYPFLGEYNHFILIKHKNICVTFLNKMQMLINYCCVYFEVLTFCFH